MLTFWVPRTGAFGILDWMDDRARVLLPVFEVRAYEDLSERMTLGAGAHIFAGVDELGPAGKAAVAAVWDQLSRIPTTRLLNDPRKASSRYDLLNRLADEGINSFRAWRADELSQHRARIQFPVFLRHRVEHTGNVTGLSHDWRQLQLQLMRCRMRGNRPADLLAVEWVDARDDEGRFRKYSAFKIGDTIVPAHVMTGGHWMVKAGTNTLTVRSVRDELEYLQHCPHLDWIRQIFALAGIDYGRLDYGVVGGRLHVWEINVNPTIGATPGRKPKPVPPEVQEERERSRDIRHAGTTSAFLSLDSGVLERVPVRVAPDLLDAFVREREAQESLARRVALLDRAFRHPLATPMRGLWRRVFSSTPTRPVPHG